MPTVALCFALPVLAQTLPEGEGKDLVAVQCNTCHDFYVRVGAGYTAECWSQPAPVYVG
jgi:cytochrome c5